MRAAPNQTFFNISVEMQRLGDTPSVRFVEIVRSDVRYRVTPRRDLTLAGSVDRRLASFVDAHLTKVSKPRMVLHEPDATVTLPHVTLANLQTHVSFSETRSHLALVRFTEISGNPQTVLRASAENLTSTIQDVAVNAYERVFQTGLALTEANQSASHSPEHRPELHKSRKRLERDIDTLLFNLEILKRHVDRAKTGQDEKHLYQEVGQAQSVMARA